MELKNIGKTLHNSTPVCSDGASSSGALTLPRSIVHEYDVEMPVLAHVTNSLDKRSYVPGYMTTSMNSMMERPQYPRTQYNIPANRAHMNVDTGLSQQSLASQPQNGSLVQTPEHPYGYEGNFCYQKNSVGVPKPPDLWIHHDQMELKNIGKTLHNSTPVCSDGASSSGALTLPRSIVHEYDVEMPVLAHVTNSLDKRSYVPGYMTTSMNSMMERPQYPRTQYNIPANRAHMNVDTGLSQQSLASQPQNGSLVQTPEHPYGYEGNFWVRFTPSTVRNDVIRNYRMSVSENPFFIFLQEMRMRVCRDSSELSSHSNMRITQMAGRLWNSMSDEEKLPYRNIAMEQQKLKRLRGRKRRSLAARNRKRRMLRRCRSRSNSSTSMSPPLGTALSSESITCDVFSEMDEDEWVSLYSFATDDKN